MSRQSLLASCTSPAAEDASALDYFGREVAAAGEAFPDLEVRKSARAFAPAILSTLRLRGVNVEFFPATSAPERDLWLGVAPIDKRGVFWMFFGVATSAEHLNILSVQRKFRMRRNAFDMVAVQQTYVAALFAMTNLLRDLGGELHHLWRSVSFGAATPKRMGGACIPALLAAVETLDRAKARCLLAVALWAERNAAVGTDAPSIFAPFYGRGFLRGSAPVRAKKIETEDVAGAPLKVFAAIRALECAYLVFGDQSRSHLEAA